MQFAYYQNSEPRKIPQSFTTNLHADYEDALEKAVTNAIEIIKNTNG